MSKEIKWKRLDAGEYESSDERFYIIKCWDRIFYNHWQLSDRTTGMEFARDTLKDCKLVAQDIREYGYGESEE